MSALYGAWIEWRGRDGARLQCFIDNGLTGSPTRFDNPDDARAWAEQYAADNRHLPGVRGFSKRLVVTKGEQASCHGPNLSALTGFFR